MRLIRAASRFAAVALAVACGLSVVGAEAASVCTQLQARLLQLDQSGGSSSSAAARTFDRPIAQQQQEIRRASAAARRFNCVSGFVLFQSRNRDPRCASLMATLDRMRSNLQRLISARAQQSAGNPFAVSRERSAVLRSMAAYGCDSINRDTPAPRTGGGLFASLFGQPTYRTNDGNGGRPYAASDTYRTVCVRTCDGYYFPISFSTVPSQFSTDAETCQQMCPGAQVSLYSYPNPGGDISQAVSISGEPYTSLPNAFLYRKEFDKACTCGAATASGPAPAPQFTEFPTDGSYIDLSGGGGDASAPASAAAPAFAPVPQPTLRPALGEDPETLANRAGGFAPRHVDSGGATAEDTTAAGKKIRIVGPAYYIAQ